MTLSRTNTYGVLVVSFMFLSVILYLKNTKNRFYLGGSKVYRSVMPLVLTSFYISVITRRQNFGKDNIELFLEGTSISFLCTKEFFFQEVRKRFLF